MRRIVLFLASTAAALALLFSYRTSWGDSLAGSDVVATGAGPVGVEPGSTAAGATGSRAGDSVVNGSVVRTQWGPVQVRVTIAGGRITDVTAIQYPDGNRRDQQINAVALPRLRTQVLAAQSADIDGVSGATVTTHGYTQSLQAALDAAHFG